MRSKLILIQENSHKALPRPEVISNLVLAKIFGFGIVIRGGAGRAFFGEKLAIVRRMVRHLCSRKKRVAQINRRRAVLIGLLGRT
jgi:hypothetical protein